MESIANHPLLTFSFVVTLVFLFYYFIQVVETPVLRFSESDFLLRVIEKSPDLTTKYYPTFWCFNQHLMLFFLMLREYRTKPYQYDKLEQLTMKDGGITGLAWSGINTATANENNPIVVVFHTISGDEQDVKTTVKYLRERYGWIVVVCIRRGHGNLPLTKPKINTMGSTSDLKEQLSYITKKIYPKNKCLVSEFQRDQDYLLGTWENQEFKVNLLQRLRFRRRMISKKPFIEFTLYIARSWDKD